MNKQQWVSRLRELHESRYAHQWAVGDHVNYAITTWGSDSCFEALQQIAGKRSTRNFYRRCAVVAALYCASLRFPALSFSVYEALRHFPIDFLTRFIPEVASSGRSCKQIVHLAIEQFGSNPSPRKQRLKRQSVNLKASVYLAALERAKAEKKQVQFWIEGVIEDYLGAEPVAAQKDAQGSSRNEGNEVLSAQPQSETTPAPEIPKRTFREPELKRKKCTCRIRLVWSSCHGRGANSNLRGDSFADRESAEVAQRQYESCHGYPPFISFCELCSAFHLYHFSPTTRSESSIHVPTQTA